MHDVQKSGLRERKKRARHDALVDATHALVRDQGLDAVTVEAICERVGVSPRTFFNYFASKEDAVLGIGDVEFDAQVVETFVAGGPSGNLVDDAVLLLRDMLSGATISSARIASAVELARKEPRLLVRQIAWIEERRAGIETVLDARRARIGVDIDTELVGTLLMGVVRATFLQWERRGADGSPADHLEQVVTDLRAVMAPPTPAPITPEGSR